MQGQVPLTPAVQPILIVKIPSAEGKGKEMDKRNKRIITKCTLISIATFNNKK